MNKNSFLIELSESDKCDSGRVPFSEQRPEQQVFSAIWALESQVNNGGFAQYFGSHDGDTANAAPSALRAIGATRCAEIVVEALRLVVPSGELPALQEDRAAVIDALSAHTLASLEAADAEFFAYPDNLTDLLYEYVSKHPASFGLIVS
jgi:hypothetical protein